MDNKWSLQPDLPSGTNGSDPKEVAFLFTVILVATQTCSKRICFFSNKKEEGETLKIVWVCLLSGRPAFDSPKLSDTVPLVLVLY